MLQVFKWTGFEWRKIEGERLDYISVGSDGECWGVLDNKVYRYDPWRMTFVEKAAPRMRAVSVGTGRKIWGVGEDLQVWKFRGGNRWKKRGDIKMQQISVGADGHAWAIEHGHPDHVYRWRSFENVWERVPSSLRLKHISVGSRGSVWGVSEETGMLHRWDTEAMTWIPTNLDSKMVLGKVSASSEGTVIAAREWEQK